MQQSHLTIWDFILTPFFILILSALAKKQRNKRYPPGHALRPYFMKALYLKFAGAIFIGLIYAYYYGGGDTFNFFYNVPILNEAFVNSPETWLKLILHTPLENDPKLYPYLSKLYWYYDPPSYAVASIASVFGLITGSNYMPIALIFAYLAFSGVWAMYRTFVNIYPKLHKELAYAFLFIPSTIVWGSSIFKDTICMFGLGWMTYTTFRIFINKDLSIKNILLLILSFYLIGYIKLYILMAFLPAVSLWILMTYSRKLSSSGLRWIVNILFMVINVVIFLFLSQKFAQELNRYSLDKIAQTANITRTYLYQISGDEGSGYDLGTFDPSIGGMFKKFPQAVAVTLFRPFLWETKKILVFLSALEALLFSFLTLKILFANRKNLKSLVRDPNVIFFLIFSLIFAFAVGITSYNFGTLSRYKIPCLPFYGALLAILLYKEKAAGK